MRPPDLITALFLLAAATGATAAVDDTVGFKAVEVTSDVWTAPDLHVLPTSTITAQDLQRLRPMVVSEALRGIPGLYVRDHGGLGGLRTMSIRGGTSAQSVVLMDGFRWNSAQSGGADLSWIPASLLHTVTVQRGAASTQWGANAMTGAVNMQLASPATNRIEATADAGSFDTWRMQMAGSAVTDAVGLLAAVETFGTAGTFPYNAEIDGAPADILRVNADVRSTSGMVRAEAGPVRVTALGRSAERGVPGAVVDGAVTQPNARLDDLDLWLLTEWHTADLSDEEFKVRIGGRYLDQQYVDPNATYSGTTGIDARYLLRDVSGDVVWRFNTDRWMHRATVSLGYIDLRGTQLDPDAADRVIRRSAAVAYEGQWSVTDGVLAEAGVRGDIFSDVGAAVNGSVGIRWSMQPSVTLRSSIGTGFRPPSFNELYFLNYGNTNLAPERSLMLSVGGIWSPLPEYFLDVNIFGSQITDLIVSIPMSPVVTSAQNVGAAVSYGVELAARASILDDRLFGQWSYTLQRVEDNTGRAGLDGTLIPYVPMEMISVQSWWDDGATIASLEWNYISYRYAQPGAEVTNLLAPYHVVNMSVGQVIPARDVTATILFRIDNVFDERYAIIRGYPVPGRTLRLTLSVRS